MFRFLPLVFILVSCSVTGQIVNPNENGVPELTGITISFNPLVLIDWLDARKKAKAAEQEENPVAPDKNPVTVTPST